MAYPAYSFICGSPADISLSSAANMVLLSTGFLTFIGCSPFRALFALIPFDDDFNLPQHLSGTGADRYVQLHYCPRCVSVDNTQEILKPKVFPWLHAAEGHKLELGLISVQVGATHLLIAAHTCLYAHSRDRSWRRRLLPSAGRKS